MLQSIITKFIAACNFASRSSHAASMHLLPAEPAKDPGLLRSPGHFSSVSDCLPYRLRWSEMSVPSVLSEVPASVPVPDPLLPIHPPQEPESLFRRFLHTLSDHFHGIHLFQLYGIRQRKFYHTGDISGPGPHYSQLFSALLMVFFAIYTVASFSRLLGYIQCLICFCRKIIVAMILWIGKCYSHTDGYIFRYG